MRYYAMSVVAWFVLLGAVLGWPFLSDSSSLGGDLIRNTIRLALLYYAAALTLMLRTCNIDWQKSSRIIRSARACWTLAWLTYLIHLVMAFHFAHGWSHANAMRHTEEVSGFGP